MNRLDYQNYAKTARQLCGESCVLLENNGVLPLGKESVISVFGRVQMETYYCGTGSGGMVNLPYLVHLLDGIREQGTVNEELVAYYEDYIKNHPYDKGEGWAKEPWSQVDPLLTEDVVKLARGKSEIALMPIGRSAGEDNDAAAEKGSFYLSDIEEANLALISQHFEKVIVLLNVGNIIDMSFVVKYHPAAVLYAWHGGCESGNGYADVLYGTVNPSGVLPDTVARTLGDNPANTNFGDPDCNLYAEDIYVGYRYFETFAPEKVLYPFGYGLSYTGFSVDSAKLEPQADAFAVSASVRNTGAVAGKKPLQIYVEAPQGKLGKPARVLVGFAKTEMLDAGESQTLEIAVDHYRFASYDEGQSAYVLESGDYHVYAGFDVRTAEEIGSFAVVEDKILRQCVQALAPTVEFDRLVHEGDGKSSYQPTPQRSYDINQRIAQERERAITPQQIESGYTFSDVMDGKISAEDFANQLSDLELIHLSRGEGMCSPKVTSGTASCFGGVTPSLVERGVPIACCADGPSGIRMDSGTMAYSMPNGTAMASTMNTALVGELFDHLGLEMTSNQVDILLGPGLNIHRSPLCGRNFEYFSEDPLLTGAMATAQLNSLHAHGVTGAIKHFACNNQEMRRHYVGAVVSERAVREIYLKGFEMAVRDADARSIMTAYNPLQGIYSASNFDLNTQILRKEWGYEGIVMTDWWAKMNTECGQQGTETQTCAMILSQNDLYMVNADAQSNSNGDDSETALDEGRLSRFELLRGGVNILHALTQLNCSKGKIPVEISNRPKNTHQTILEHPDLDIKVGTQADISKLDTSKGILNRFHLTFAQQETCALCFELKAEASELAQITMEVKINAVHQDSITLKGGTTKQFSIEIAPRVDAISSALDISFGESGMVVKSMEVRAIV